MEKKISKIESGEIFLYGGFEWIKLKETGMALMKDILEERAFDKESSDWAVSSLREYLNNDFYNLLIKNGGKTGDFAKIETSLESECSIYNFETCSDIVSLMTKKLFLNNKYRILDDNGNSVFDNWWWLVTPCDFAYDSPNNELPMVLCIDERNTIQSDYPFFCSYGVRPIIKLDENVTVLMVQILKDE